LEPGTLKTQSDPSKSRNVTKKQLNSKKLMPFEWLLRVSKGGRAKMLTSAKNNINILSSYKLQTTYLHESLEGLNSSLAQSDAELLSGE